MRVNYIRFEEMESNPAYSVCTAWKTSKQTASSKTDKRMVVCDQNRFHQVVTLKTLWNWLQGPFWGNSMPSRCLVFQPTKKYTNVGEVAGAQKVMPVDHLPKQHHQSLSQLQTLN